MRKRVGLSICGAVLLALGASGCCSDPWMGQFRESLLKNSQKPLLYQENGRYHSNLREEEVLYQGENKNIVILKPENKGASVEYNLDF